MQYSQKNKLQSIARPFAPVAQGSADEDGVISEGAARAWLGTGSLKERFERSLRNARHAMRRPFTDDHPIIIVADRHEHEGRNKDDTLFRGVW